MELSVSVLSPPLQSQNTQWGMEKGFAKERGNEGIEPVEPP
jgi:hypothetical protein